MTLHGSRTIVGRRSRLDRGVADVEAGPGKSGQSCPGGSRPVPPGPEVWPGHSRCPLTTGPVDAGAGFHFLNAYESGFGGARIAAVPGGGWVAAFGHSTSITIGGTVVDVSGRYDIVVVKLDASGAPVWVKPIVGGDDDDVQGLAVASDGSIYLAGQSFSPTLDFGQGKTVAKPASSAIGFIAKLDAAGDAQWAQRVRTPGGIRNTTVATAAGKLVFAGTYTTYGDTLTYTTSGGETLGPDFMKLTTSRGFAMALDPATGFATWLSVFGSGDEVNVTSAALRDDGEVILGGSYSGGPLASQASASIAPAPAVLNGFNGFVLKLTTTGATAWARGFTGDTAGVATSGNVVVGGGTFSGTTDLGGGSRASVGKADAWAASFDPATGAPIWDKTFGGLDDDGVFGVALDGTSAILGVATKGATGALDGVSLPATPGALFAKLDGAGKVGLIRPLAATPTTYTELGDVAAQGGAFVGIGTYMGSIDFGSGARASTSTSGRSDTFIVGFGP